VVVVVVGGTVVVVVGGTVVVVVGGTVVVVVGGEVVVVGGEVVVVGGEVVVVVVVPDLFDGEVTWAAVVVVDDALVLVLVDGGDELVLDEGGLEDVEPVCELLPVATIGRLAAPGECSSVATITPAKMTTAAASPARSRQLAGGAAAKTNSLCTGGASRPPGSGARFQDEPDPVLSWSIGRTSPPVNGHRIDITGSAEFYDPSGRLDMQWALCLPARVIQAQILRKVSRCR
jgi:hypothetical protein